MKTKVLVLGAGGVVGQHMLVNTPGKVKALFTRRTGGGPWIAFDADETDPLRFLDRHDPDVVINLIGENSVDVVEKDPEKYEKINTLLPSLLTGWSIAKDRLLIQGSTQGIFDGKTPRYGPSSAPSPITHYGRQKTVAETSVLEGDKTKIARLTFVLGVRPFQDIGRKNPIEVMLSAKKQLQVNDRFFSPLFAADAAEILWDMALNPDKYEKITHLGNPERCCRFSIASDFRFIWQPNKNFDIQPVSHEYFEGIAQRPRDTTWEHKTCQYRTGYIPGISNLYADWIKVNK